MKSYRYLSFILIMILALLDAKASEEYTYIIGVEDNRYFPHYTYENGEYKGIGRRVIDKFFSSKGYKFEYRVLPVRRLFHNLVDLEIDFKYPDNPFWSIALKEGKGVIYSNPVMPNTDGVMVLEENYKKKTANEIEILGTIRGFTAPQWLGRVEKGKLILTEIDNSRLLVKQVLAGRIEGAYANIDVMKYILREEYKTPDALVFDPSLPHTRDYYYLSTIKYPEIIDEFNVWLVENKDFLDSLKKEFNIMGHPEF